MGCVCNRTLPAIDRHHGALVRQLLHGAGSRPAVQNIVLHAVLMLASIAEQTGYRGARRSRLDCDCISCVPSRVDDRQRGQLISGGVWPGERINCVVRSSTTALLLPTAGDSRWPFARSDDLKEKLNHVRINEATEQQHNRVVVLECAMANVNYGATRVGLWTYPAVSMLRMPLLRAVL